MKDTDHAMLRHEAMARQDEPCRETAQQLSPLDDIAERIHRYANQVGDIAASLNEHANRVHGCPPPEPKGDSGVAPSPDGALARIDDAFKHLEYVVGQVATAAGRNCTLA